MMPPHPAQLRELLGDLDVYLFDQFLKGRFQGGMKVLDLGCGGGRNIVYLMRTGFDVCAVDVAPHAVEQVRRMAEEVAPHLPKDNFRVEPAEKTSFAGGEFDAVICNALLHFCQDEDQFWAIIEEVRRLLRPGGFLFARLMSTVGIEERVQLVHGRRFLLPQGQKQFLVDEEMLQRGTAALEGTLLDPLKHTNVQNLRTMTTWVVKRAG